MDQELQDKLYEKYPSLFSNKDGASSVIQVGMIYCPLFAGEYFSMRKT
jgi:hypothetical protein